MGIMTKWMMFSPFKKEQKKVDLIEEKEKKMQI